jgi:hypothetical protein
MMGHTLNSTHPLPLCLACAPTVLLLLPVGHAAVDATVPDIHRKELHEICTYY